MIIDSSAILAVIGKESGYERIVHQLAASPATRIGAPTRLETGIVLTARFGPRGKTVLARFLQENSVAGEPLLCRGNDFGQTDLPLVSLDADETPSDEESGTPG